MELYTFLQKRGRLVPASLCAVLLLAGCGGSGYTAPSTPRPGGSAESGGGATTKSTGGNKAPNVDGCSLVTRAEAGAIMGEIREAPKPVTSLRDEKTCSYLNNDGASVTLRVYGSDQFE